MSMVVPTIMAETLDDLQASIQRLKPFAQRVHFDISDGDFAPVLLLNESQLYWEQGWQVDVHAMVSRPSEHIPQLIALKPDLVIIHAETNENTVLHLQQLKQNGIRAGVALLKTTVPSTVADAIKEADHVMIFSGDLGKFGGTASMMQLEKIKLVKEINPNVEIGWDGGVNPENVFTLATGGVDVLNAGGAINKADNPAEVYKQMMQEASRKGVM